MKGLFKGKVLGVFLIAALILTSTAGLGVAVATAQSAADKEIVMNSSGDFNSAVEVVYDVPGMILFGDVIPQYPVNDQYQLLKSIGQKAYISDDELLNSGVYLLATRNESIRNISTTNGEVLFLTNVNGSGWNLEANQSMSITIDIDLSANYSDKEKGELIRIGYYHNGIYTNISYADAYDIETGELIGVCEAVKVMPGAEFSFIAPEAGEYFLYVQNCCAGMQNLASVTVTLG